MTTISFYTTGRFVMTNSYTSRRELFVDGDRLKFYEIDATHARLVVYDADDLANEVLPSYILLELVKGELVGADYGRKKLTFKPHGTRADWIVYEGDFINSSMHQPDEGGDGDPR